MKPLGLNKRDKLCSTAAIDRLFSRGKAGADKAAPSPVISSAMAYPLRAVWELGNSPQLPECSDNSEIAATYRGGAVKFLISIPKRRVRHAVDRVAMRRRVREAYRLHRRTVEARLHASGLTVNIAFVYVADGIKDYAAVEASVTRLLEKCLESATSSATQPACR